MTKVNSAFMKWNETAQIEKVQQQPTDINTIPSLDLASISLARKFESFLEKWTFRFYNFLMRCRN